VKAQRRDQRRVVRLARAAGRVGGAEEWVAVEVDLRDDGLMAGRLRGGSSREIFMIASGP
jgi:hypothetical protein